MLCRNTSNQQPRGIAAAVTEFRQSNCVSRHQEAPLREIVCDSAEAALALKARATEADRIEFEDRQFNGH
jgi:hypothetical protein